MPRRVAVDQPLLDRLSTAVSANTPYATMASDAGVCVDTLKRILQRHDLANFEGAKYVVAMEQTIVQWTRPCTRCGDSTSRPKFQYRCDDCTAVLEARSGFLPDGWI